MRRLAYQRQSSHYDLYETMVAGSDGDGVVAVRVHWSIGSNGIVDD
jgi:hypothetical protein